MCAPTRGHTGRIFPGGPSVKRYTSTVAVAALLLVGSAAAYAQDAQQGQPVPAAAPAAKDDAEEIVVTGSRIKRQDLVANSPVSIVSTEELKLTQTVNAEDIIRELPQAAPGISPGVNNGNPGVATINLRGLDDERTLVLIDGKRFVGYDSEGIVDLNNIPTPLLERIDVVTGGASAVYGSDAIAGVVNFILKDDFEGVQLDYDYANALRGSENTHNIGITMGGNFAEERGNAAIYVGWTQRDPVSQGDRPFSATARRTSNGAKSGSSTDTDGKIIHPAGADGFLAFAPNGDLIPRGSRRFNFNPFNLLQVPEERYQATGVVHYDLTEWATVYGRATFAQTQVDSIIAPSGTFFNEFDFPFDSIFLTGQSQDLLFDPDQDGTLGSGAFQQDVFGTQFCLNNPQLIGAFDTLDSDCDGTVGVGDNARYAFGRRTTEVGTRNTRNRTQAYQVVGGLRGDITMLEGWSYDFSVQHARTELSRIFENDLRGSRVQDVLSGSSASANPGAVDGGRCLSTAPTNCVLGNMFGDNNLNAASASYMSLQINEDIYTTQDVIMLSADGDLGESIHIPGAGPIGVALGGEWRRTRSESFPDDCYKTVNCSLGFGSTTAVIAEQTVKEIFGEILVPLLEDKPFAHSLSFEGGYRYADYSTVGGVDAYKVGGEWAPLEDLRFRILYQNAVRAPNLFETSQPLTPTLDNSGGDPCAAFNEATSGTTVDLFTRNLCVATGAPAARYQLVGPGVFRTLVPDVISGQINSLSSGNIDLREETSRTLTVGGVYSPSWLEGLTLQIDWYRVEIEDAISNFDADVILDNCYSQAKNPTGNPNTQLCAFLRRNPSTGGLIGDSNYGLLQPESNISTLEVSGVDVQVDYELDLADWGRVDINFLGTKLIQIDDKPSELTPTNVCKGLYGPICNSPNASVDFIQRTTWYFRDFNFGYRWSFVRGTDFEDPANATPAYASIGDVHYIDLTMGWEPSSLEMLEGFRFQVGIENLFDQNPPEVGSEAGPTDQNSGNTFPGSYNTVGRVLTVSLSKKF